MGINCRQVIVGLPTDEPKSRWVPCPGPDGRAIFTALPHTTQCLDADGREIGEIQERSGRDAVVRRLRRMDAADLGVQKRLVYLAHVRTSGPGREAHAEGGDVLMGEVRRIAEGFRATAVPVAGDVSWVGVLPAGADRPARFGYLDASFGYGGAGVALFLAAYSRVTGSEVERDLAMCALAPVLRPGSGGSSAAEGLPYALVRVSVLLGEPGLLEEAERRVKSATPEDGAGLLPVLVALYRATGDRALLDRAAATGERRAEEVVRRAERRGSFANGLRDVLIPGLAEGVAGIGYGLLRLRISEVLTSALLRE